MSYRKTRRDLRRLDNVTVAAGGASVALGAPVITGAGATEAKGLNIVANANGTGSNLLVTVWGLVA